MSCIEHLKGYTDKELAALFAADTIITKRMASRVFVALKKEGEFDPKKCASQMGFS